MKLDVILDLEIGVVLECRMVKIERYRDQALTVTRHQMQFALKMPNQLRIRDLVLEEGERADMQWPVARLAVNERGVLTSEPMAQFFNCDRLFSHCSLASNALANLIGHSSFSAVKLAKFSRQPRPQPRGHCVRRMIRSPALLPQRLPPISAST